MSVFVDPYQLLVEKILQEDERVVKWKRSGKGTYTISGSICDKIK